MDGLRFEGVCNQIFRRWEFRTKKRGGVGDGGVDLLIWNDYGKIVVECKHHKEPIGREPVQKLHSAYQNEGALGAVLISTGGFKPTARNYRFVHKHPGTLDDIIRMEGGGNSIILMDKDALKSIARRVGIMLHDEEHPDARDTPLTPIKALFASLKSYPTDANALVRPERRGSQIDTYWLVKISIDRLFLGSSNQIIHHMKKRKTYVCDARGKIRRGELAKLVKSGGNAVPKRSNFAAVKAAIISSIREDCTKRIKFRGRKGAPSFKACKPSAEDIKFEPPKAIGVESTKFVVNILNKPHEWQSPYWDRKIECYFCHTPQKLLNKLQICNYCGTISHEKKCGGECGKCGKTLCGKCTVLQKGRLRQSVFCPDCFNKQKIT